MFISDPVENSANCVALHRHIHTPHLCKQKHSSGQRADITFWGLGGQIVFIIELAGF